MAKSKWLVVCAISLVTIVGSLHVHAEQDATLTGLAKRFEGKVVMVVLRGTNALETQSSSEALENVAIEKIGDQYFMTGGIHLRSTELESPSSSWRNKASGGIAINQIHQYYVFSPEQYDKAMQTIEDATKK